MIFLFKLSKQNINLSKYEIMRLFGVTKGKLSDDLLVIDTNRKDFYRLAYTKEVYQIIIKTAKTKLIKDCEKYNWKKVIGKTYSVGKTYRIPIAENIKKKCNSKVNLKQTETRIEVFEIGNIIYIGKLVHEFDKSILKRKPHLRPKLHPTSLDPRLARCAINLTGIRKGNVIDPFCGSGGILIEAGLMGLKPVGLDIQPKLISMAMENLNFYNIKDYKLIKEDAIRFAKHIKRPFVIVTDLPYGKGSKISNKLSLLYSNFIDSLYKTMKKGEYSVIMFPNFVGAEFLSKFKIIKKFEQYLHKSLTKKLYLIQKTRS